MKFGRKFIQINVHRLKESDFFDMTSYLTLIRFEKVWSLAFLKVALTRTKTSMNQFLIPKTPVSFFGTKQQEHGFDKGIIKK